MLIQFIEYTIVFALIGHPNYLVLSILASVTTIIPYFGGLLVNILAVIIASVISPKLLILTLIVCVVCPSIDGYIIGPKVYGKTNQLPALVNIFAVFAGGILGGFWGIVISLPITIILITTYKFFREDINNKIETIYYKDIRNVQLRRGVIDTMLGVGDVHFDLGMTDSKGRPATKAFLDIENPQEVYNHVQKIVMDIQTDIHYPNGLRPEENPGYRTKYTGM